MGGRTGRWSSGAGLAAALWCGLIGGLASGLGAVEPPGGVETPPRELAVWCGNCSRSLRCADSFATVAEAARRAAELRKNHLHVVVLQGESNYGNALSAIRRPAAGSKQPTPWQKCSVHTVGCRLGSRELPNASPTDAATAEREAAKLREAGQDAVVVYSYVRK